MIYSSLLWPHLRYVHIQVRFYHEMIFFVFPHFSQTISPHLQVALKRSNVPTY